MLQNPNLADVRPGDEIDGFYLLTDATVRTSSNGSRYLSATLCDRSGSLDLKMWDYGENIGPEDNGAAVRVRGQVLDYRGTRQLNVRKLRLAEASDGVNAETLMPAAPIDAEEAMRYVEGILASLQDADYRKLAETLFSRRKEQFKTVPAAKSIHHGFRNGLLMHTANMLQTAEFLSDLYAEVVNRDLLLTGTLLHDMAKSGSLPSHPSARSGTIPSKGGCWAIPSWAHRRWRRLRRRSGSRRKSPFCCSICCCRITENRNSARRCCRCAPRQSFCISST